MRIAFYEDRAAGGFGPIGLTRPVFELVCGQWPLRERVLRQCAVSTWGAFLRDELVESYRDVHPHARINEFDWLAEGPTLLVNGRWLPTSEALAKIGQDEAGMVDDTLVYITLSPSEVPHLTRPAAGGECTVRWDETLQQVARSRRPVQATGTLLKRPWDLINHNAQQLEADFRLRPPARTELGSHVAILGSPEEVSVDPAATIEPFVVLDARQGPISVDRGAVVQSFTRLEGPCHVGAESQLLRAHVRGATTIGPVCRVGGEVEASILHGYVNKYHDGFLGHSYVSPWVNLGAQTTTSDLKNDYSAVQVPLAGEMIDTGTTKVGCFIGDHTKTAIGSLFNTGSSVGVMCMILPGGELLPKHIPSFTGVRQGRLIEAYDLNQGLEAARAAMRRRNRELTPAEERLLRSLFDRTRAERERALRRSAKKAGAGVAVANGAGPAKCFP